MQLCAHISTTTGIAELILFNFDAETHYKIFVNKYKNLSERGESPSVVLQASIGLQW